jgi:co-chaperonin GroES (HSP10)
MSCKTCGKEDEEIKISSKIVKRHGIPFVCKECGSLDFKYHATRDIVFIWPDPPVAKIGSIVIPDFAQQHDEYGVVISVGKGCYDKKRRMFVHTQLKIGDYVLYDKTVPWQMDVAGSDDKMHLVKFMGELDVKATVLDDDQLASE